NYEGSEYLMLNDPLATVKLGAVDLTDVRNIEDVYTVTGEEQGSSTISLHSGSVDGPVIASATTKGQEKAMQPSELRLRVDREQRKAQEEVWLVAKREGEAPVIVLTALNLRS